MAAVTNVTISIPEEQRLLDLFSLSSDLFCIRDYIKLYISLSMGKRDAHLHFQLTDCVVTTIFIRYGRCFKEGVRVKTQKELHAMMDEEDLMTHQVAIDIRDKHFAHSVNCFESPHTSVWLRTGSEEKKITSVSAASHGITAPDMFVFHNMLILVEKLHKWVLEEQKIEGAKLLEIVKKRFTLDELYSLIGKGNRPVWTYGDIKKRRRMKRA